MAQEFSRVGDRALLKRIGDSASKFLGLLVLTEKKEWIKIESKRSPLRNIDGGLKVLLSNGRKKLAPEMPLYNG